MYLSVCVCRWRKVNRERKYSAASETFGVLLCKSSGGSWVVPWRCTVSSLPIFTFQEGKKGAHCANMREGNDIGGRDALEEREGGSCFIYIYIYI